MRAAKSRWCKHNDIKWETTLGSLALQGTHKCILSPTSSPHDSNTVVKRSIDSCTLALVLECDVLSSGSLQKEATKKPLQELAHITSLPQPARIKPRKGTRAADGVRARLGRSQIASCSNSRGRRCYDSRSHAPFAIHGLRVRPTAATSDAIVEESTAAICWAGSRRRGGCAREGAGARLGLEDFDASIFALVS
jgi:hypothetical protein